MRAAMPCTAATRGSLRSGYFTRGVAFKVAVPRHHAVSCRASDDGYGPSSSTSLEAPSAWLHQQAAHLVVLGAAAMLALPMDAYAARGTIGPIDANDTKRCEVTAFDKFAETRAAFSQESAGGNMVEAIVDVRECDFSNQDLSGKVMSGVVLQRANFSGAKFTGSQFARADATGANLANADFTDTNLYGTLFNGADLEGAQFENSILTGSLFGKDATGTWANLKGAHFEGALVSSSDVARICENPTLELTTKKYELGCRSSR